MVKQSAIDKSNLSTRNTPRDYVRVLFRHKYAVSAVIITSMLGVITALLFKTPVYEAQVKMLISPLRHEEADSHSSYQDNKMSLTQSELVKANPVMELTVRTAALYNLPLDYEAKYAAPVKRPVIKLRSAILAYKLGSFSKDERQALLFRYAVEKLKNNVEVEPVKDTHLYIVRVTDFSPLAAAIIANTISRAYAIFDLEQLLAEYRLKYGDKSQNVAQLKESIESMKKLLSGQPLADVDAIGLGGVKIVEQAQLPLTPKGMPHPLVVVLSFFVSLFLGVATAFILEYMDQTFKSPQEVESYLSLPYLGSVPKRRKVDDKILIKDIKRKLSHLNVYDNLSDQIYMILKDRGLKSVLLTSALLDEGSTLIGAHLGIYLSYKVGHKVLVVDANFRNPSVTHSLGLPEGKGLADVVEGKVQLHEAIHQYGDKMAVLGAGKTELNPITILDSAAMKDIIKKVKDKYEVILIDCPDLRDYKDATAVAQFVDGVVLVVNESATRKQVVKNAIGQLVEKKINILGVILNNRRFDIPKVIYERV